MNALFCSTGGLNKAAGGCLAGLVLAAVSSGLMAQSAVEAPRTVRVALDNNYAPYSFQSDDGKLQGILIDQWRAWEKKTGLKAEIHAMDWSEAVRRMRAGEFDVIDAIVETPDRRDYFEFTPPYATIEVPIFFRRDISGLTDLASLKGFPVGVKEGDQHIEKLRASGVTTLIPFQNFPAMVEAARQQKINVFVADAPSVLYVLHKTGLEAGFRQSAPIFRDRLQRAVRKGDAATLRSVMAGFAAMTPNELKQIDEKWFGRTIDQPGRYLIYAGWAAVIAIVLIAGLVAWNRTLHTKVLKRTAALGESEQRFRQIADHIHEVFWLTTADLSKTLYVSPGYETVWGRSRESLYHDPRSFMAAIMPEDRPRVIEAIEKYRERGFEVEYRIVRPDGSVRWIWDRGFPIRDETARTYRIAGIAEDITERKSAVAVVKQSEDRVRLIIDTIPTMAWSVRPDGVVDFLNQRWVDYAGLSLEEYSKDQTGPIHPDDVPGVMEKWFANRVTGEPYDHEMRLRRADGVYRWFLVRTAPLRDERGSVVKWFGASIDIEDRKRAEMRLQMLIDAIPHQIWSGPPDGTLDYCNAGWRSYAGLELQELQGEGWQAMLHPDDRERVLPAWKKSVTEGTPYEQEERHRGADGQYRWFLSRGVPLRDPEGRIIRWFGTNTDIEDRKAAEEALQSSERKLREQEKFYRMLTENTNDFIRMHELDGRSIYGSPSVERLYGRQPTHIFESAHPEDLERCRQWWSRILAGRRERLTWRVCDQDGRWRWMETRASVVQHQERQHVMTYCRDITERKEAEEALQQAKNNLRTVLDTAPALIHTARPDGYLDYFNQRWLNYVGLPLEKLEGWAWLAVIHPEDKEGEEQHWRACVASGEPFEREVRTRRADGKYRWMLHRKVAMRDGSGNIVKWYGSGIDIDDRKEAEEALRRTGQQLHALVGRLHTAREDEAKRIARELHDVLGQKLTALNMELADMETKLGDASPNQRAQLARMNAAVDQTIEVVQELSGELRLAQLDILGLTAAIEWQLKEFSRRSGIPCKITRLDEVNNLSDAQRTTVFRILQEALTNIVRHAGATEMEASLRTGPDELTLRISDNGRGITAAELNDRKAIGLLGMRERAQSLDGNLTITGRPGAGTTVVVTIPLRQSPLSEHAH